MRLSGEEGFGRRGPGRLGRARIGPLCRCLAGLGVLHALEDGTYLASESTSYPIPALHGEVRERRRQATHPAKTKPELVARGPNQCWSSDIEKLKGPKRGGYYGLCVVLEIFSCYVVAWCVAPTESAELAKALMPTSFSATRSPRASSGSTRTSGNSVTSNPVTELLTFLGIGRGHSCPHVPTTPTRRADSRRSSTARAFCEQFFSYYCHEHRHSEIGYHRPASVHGTAAEVRAERAETLEVADAANPCPLWPPPPVVPPELPSIA